MTSDLHGILRGTDLLRSVPTADLEKASATYERQVDEVVAGEDEVAGYVHELALLVPSGMAWPPNVRCTAQATT